MLLSLSLSSYLFSIFFCCMRITLLSPGVISLSLHAFYLICLFFSYSFAALLAASARVF